MTELTWKTDDEVGGSTWKMMKLEVPRGNRLVVKEVGHVFVCA